MVEGETASWQDTTDARHFCPSCGSALFGIAEGTGEVEMRLGVFDQAPTDLVPTYELWSVRRERWMPALPDTEQFAGNRSLLA
jgi:hypothetical protein